jgi:hypothetical protein
LCSIAWIFWLLPFKIGAPWPRLRWVTFYVKAILLLPVEMLCDKVLQIGQLWKGLQIACPDRNNLSWISGSINTHMIKQKWWIRSTIFVHPLCI